MDQQEASIKKLTRIKFRECHRMKFTAFRDDGDTREIVVMKRRIGPTTYYHEVNPDGKIDNGLDVSTVINSHKNDF